jgi:uncharacterized repeat protein (TIGR03803 family)
MKKNLWLTLVSLIGFALGAQAQSYTVMHAFTGGADGAYPYYGVIGRGGSLYGVTEQGGTYGYGTLFSVPVPDFGGTDTIIRTFKGQPNGKYPSGALVRDAAGNFYGPTSGGGYLGYGDIFKITPAGVETKLIGFDDHEGGGSPCGPLALDLSGNGNLYGAALTGGAGRLQNGYGMIFGTTTTGASDYTVHSFQGVDGSSPCGVILDAASANLYGVAAGAIYKINQPGSVNRTFTLLGWEPSASWTLALDSAGNIYGTTQYHGANGYGTVFKMDANGVETVLYNFAGSPDGAYPMGGVVLDASGNLYGTTSAGGAYGQGTIFQIVKGVESVLYSFTGGTDGGNPYAGVVRGIAGTLYGTTPYGGSTAGMCGTETPSGCGVVFSVK